jgi:hypothetical protein
MDATPEEGGARAGTRWSGWRLWAVLLGGLVLFLVAFDLLERLVTPDAPPPTALTDQQAESLEPIRPEITKLEGGGVRIKVGRLNTTTIYLDDEGQVDALIACIEEGVESSSSLTDGEAAQPPASDGFIARRVRAQQVQQEVIRIQEACMVAALDTRIPPIPPLPTPPATQ